MGKLISKGMAALELNLALTTDLMVLRPVGVPHLV